MEILLNSNSYAVISESFTLGVSQNDSVYEKYGSKIDLCKRAKLTWRK